MVYDFKNFETPRQVAEFLGTLTAEQAAAAKVVVVGPRTQPHPGYGVIGSFVVWFPTA